MIYIWTEDSKAGFDFWNQVNEVIFDNKIVVESKGSNQHILNDLETLLHSDNYSVNDLYFIAFDIVVNNTDIFAKYEHLKRLIANAPYKNIFIFDMICFEQIILSFKYLVQWTGTGKEKIIHLRDMFLKCINGSEVDISLLTPELIEYFNTFKLSKRTYEKVIKALVGELTQSSNYWSVKSNLGECWYKNCNLIDCNKDCNTNELKSGKEKFICLTDNSIAIDFINLINTTPANNL